MTKICWAVIAFLLLIIAVGVYKFVYQGAVSGSSDGRTSISLNAAERDFVLAEMRLFLTSVQQITQGLSADDMQQVAEHARRVGNAVQVQVPASLVGKLPLAATHSKFDQLAMDAADLGDREHTLAQLAELMQNCVACHAVYRIDVTDDAAGGSE